LSDLINEGRALIADADSSSDTTDLEQKLDMMEARWHDIVEFSEQQTRVIDDRLSLWQDYRQTLDSISQSLDEVCQSVHEHRVTSCDAEQATQLLHLYYVSVQL